MKKIENTIYNRYQKAIKVMKKYDAMLEELRTIKGELLENDEDREKITEMYGELIMESEKLNDVMFEWVNREQ